MVSFWDVLAQCIEVMAIGFLLELESIFCFGADFCKLMTQDSAPIREMGADNSSFGADG
jgi:hypothetical protein